MVKSNFYDLWFAYKARHRVSSLRLIKPDMDYHQSINVALTFEQKTFEDNPDHVSTMSLSSKTKQQRSY